jgi:hypothetical protein
VHKHFSECNLPQFSTIKEQFNSLSHYNIPRIDNKRSVVKEREREREIKPRRGVEINFSYVSYKKLLLDEMIA